MDKINKILETIRNKIQKSSKPLMFFDVDTDGSTSYLQLKRVFKKIKGFPLDKDFKKQKKLLNLIEDFSKFDLILVFDIPFLSRDLLSEFYNELGFKGEMIWVDHHPGNDENLIKEFNIFHFNPLNFNEKDNRAASYFAHLISDSLDNLDLVSLGTVSDFFLLDILIDFYNYDKFKFKLLFKIKEEKLKEIFDFISKNKFNDDKVREEREDIIRFLSYESGMGKYKNFFDFICKLENIEDSVKAFRIIEKLSMEDLIAEINAGKSFPFNEYLEISKQYNERLNKVLTELNGTNNPEINLYCYDYIGKISFAKTLAEELNYKLSNSKVVCVCFKKFGKEWYSCSIRGKGVIVNEIVFESLQGLNGRGGGHPFAAGVSINAKDYSKFKARLRKKFENIS